MDWATQKHSYIRQIRSHPQNGTRKDIRVLTKYEEYFSHEMLESRNKQEMKQSRMLSLPGTTGKS